MIGINPYLVTVFLPNQKFLPTALTTFLATKGCRAIFPTTRGGLWPVSNYGKV